MRASFGKSLSFVSFVLALTISCRAEPGILVVHIKDIYGRPVAGVELAAEGSSESATSDRFGRARIKIDPHTRANEWISLQLVASPLGKDFVLISPWDSSIQVPPFDGETVNFVSLVVVTRGDRMMLENGIAVAAIVAKINRKNAPHSKEGDADQQRREALENIARAFALAPADVDKAIRAWGEHIKDPYNKGMAALYENRYSLASREFSISVEIREKELAPVQAAAADATFFLGQSKYEEGKYRESVAAYRKTLKLRPDDSLVLNSLGLSSRQAGYYAEAEQFCKRALEVDEKDFGPNDPKVARDLNSFAELLKEKAAYAEAKQMFQRALEIDENASGPESSDVARDMNNLAQLLRITGDYTRAEPLFRRALAIHMKVLGPAHSTVGLDINDLAELLGAMGNFTEAESLFKEAMEIHENILGLEHPVYAIDIGNFAILLLNAGDYPAAEPLFRRALAIDEKVFGPDHPTVAIALNNLGALLKRKGEYAAAEPLYRQALKIDEKALGPDHPSVSRDLNNLARLFSAKRDYSTAEPLFRRALDIDEKALGPGHPTVKTIREHLADLLEERAKVGHPK